MRLSEDSSNVRRRAEGNEREELNHMRKYQG